jgi:hypothetical protein
MSKAWLEVITERVANYRASYLERLEQNKTRAARLEALRPAWEEYNDLTHQEEAEKQEGRNSSKWWRSILANALMDLEDEQRKAPLPTLSDWIPPGADIREGHDRLLTGPVVGGSGFGKNAELQRLANEGVFYGAYRGQFQSVDSGRYLGTLKDINPQPCAHERRFPESGACVACGEPRLTGEAG